MKRLRPTSEHSLESLPFFPYIAWALVVGFALFVGGITLQLKDATERMAIQSLAAQQAFETNVSTSSRIQP